jgi:hypothetical protein
LRFVAPTNHLKGTKMTDRNPPPLPGDETNDWFYAVKGQQSGPVTGSALKSLLEQNQIGAETLVWHEGMPEWIAFQDSDLADLLGSQPPPLPMIGGQDGVQNGQSPTKARMIDWLQCIKLPFGLLFSPLIIIVALIILMELAPHTLTKQQVDAIFFASFALTLLGPIAFINQIRGFAFNLKKDRLAFPRHLFRRKVKLSAIHDANCQTATKPAFQLTNTIIGLVSVGQVKGLGNTKRYFVNLSGEFGTRRLIFHTKYKRDQFLSLLRRFAPHARITRWA